MPLLSDIRSLFSRKKRVPVIDLNITQAHGLQEATRDVDVMPTSNGSDLPFIESKPMRLRSNEEPQRGYHDVMDLVYKLSEHLDRQTERTERLLELLEKLPQGLEALPEFNRQSAKMLELLGQHLRQAEVREEALNATLNRLNQTAGHQTDVLGLLQQQLDANNQSSTKIIETVVDIRPVLIDLAENTKHSGDLLSDISQSAENREVRLVETLKRTQYWVVAALVLCGLTAAAAVVVALIALSGR
jgi:hypothetical protein